MPALFKGGDNVKVRDATTAAAAQLLAAPVDGLPVWGVIGGVNEGEPKAEREANNKSAIPYESLHCHFFFQRSTTSPP